MNKTIIAALSLLASFCVNARTVQNDPSPGVEFEVLYKIGRWDSAHTFHGTDYNDKRYLDKQDCLNGYADTLNQVRVKAQAKGAAKEVQDKHVAAFQKLYECQEIVVDPNYDIEPQPAPAAPLVTQLEPVPEQGPKLASYGPLEPSYLPQRMPIYPQAKPVRPYFMAEFMSTPGYKPYWVTYASVYESPAQCHRALRELVQDEYQKLEADFMRMSKDYNASVNFQFQMQQLKARHRRISCVMDGRL